jgi:tetratricopeptide (TPR) repeat protein
MLTLPLSRELESVAQYYRALSLNRGGRGDITSAESLFEKAADSGSTLYKARAMAALGTNCLASGDANCAMSFYREVMAILARDRVPDPMTCYVATRMTAVIRGMNGDHRGALADLEKMFPLVRIASSQQPYAYYDYLNTLAVELCEAGRLEEARRASEIALASPFASAYPEWRETRGEIELKGRCSFRSTVAFTQRTPQSANLITLPRTSIASTAIPLVAKSQPPARVIKFPTRTPSMPQQSERRQGLDASEKRRIVSDKLYEMFMSALQDRPINLKLVEKLYIVFLEGRKQG